MQLVSYEVEGRHEVGVIKGDHIVSLSLAQAQFAMLPDQPLSVHQPMIDLIQH